MERGAVTLSVHVLVHIAPPYFLNACEWLILCGVSCAVHDPGPAFAYNHPTQLTLRVSLIKGLYSAKGRQGDGAWSQEDTEELAPSAPSAPGLLVEADALAGYQAGYLERNQSGNQAVGPGHWPTGGHCTACNALNLSGSRYCTACGHQAEEPPERH